jgi:hypothetical protein
MKTLIAACVVPALPLGSQAQARLARPVEASQVGPDARLHLKPWEI